MKRSMEIRWAEVRFGLLLVVALVLLALGIFAVGERTRLFTPKTMVQVVLPNVQGLRIGAPVWLSGVVIGTVADIAFAEPMRSDLVTVTLEVEAPALQRLGPDAKITIKTRGVLGEKYVDITPGSLPGGLPVGPLQGQPALGLDEVVEEAYSSFARLGRLVDTLEKPDGTLGKVLYDPTLYDALVRLSNSLEKLAVATTEGEGTLPRLMRDPSLYGRIESFTQRGEQMAVRVEGFLDTLEQADGTFNRLVHDPQLYQSALGAAERASASMQRLESLLAQVEAGKGSAGKMITEEDLHDQLVRTMQDLDVLVRDIRENPGRYVKFSLF